MKKFSANVARVVSISEVKNFTTVELTEEQVKEFVEAWTNPEVWTVKSFNISGDNQTINVKTKDGARNPKGNLFEVCEYIIRIRNVSEGFAVIMEEKEGNGEWEIKGHLAVCQFFHEAVERVERESYHFSQESEIRWVSFSCHSKPELYSYSETHGNGSLQVRFSVIGSEMALDKCMELVGE